MNLEEKIEHLGTFGEFMLAKTSGWLGKEPYWYARITITRGKTELKFHGEAGASAVEAVDSLIKLIPQSLFDETTPRARTFSRLLKGLK